MSVRPVPVRRVPAMLMASIAKLANRIHGSLSAHVIWQPTNGTIGKMITHASSLSAYVYTVNVSDEHFVVLRLVSRLSSYQTYIVKVNKSKEKETYRGSRGRSIHPLTNYHHSYTYYLLLSSQSTRHLQSRRLQDRLAFYS